MPKFLTNINSQVPNGQQPISVESSSLITNLNADLLDGNHASDFVLHSNVYTKQEIDAQINNLKSFAIAMSIAMG